MGIGVWGLGIGEWGLGPIPNPQSPIPNPQSPFNKLNKKFNEENTCKDPFDNMEIINGQLNIKKNDDDADGKTRVLCNCLIC